MSPHLSAYGPITSSIDWCEENFQLTRFVAEPVNTFSNLSFVLLGAFAAMHELVYNAPEKVFAVLGASVCTIGLGSMAFHGTLTRQGQQLDEIPMVYHLLICLYILHRDSLSVQKYWAVGALAIYGSLFTYFQMKFMTTTLFQVHFIAGLIGLSGSAYLKYNKFGSRLPPETSRLILLFLVSGLSGMTCWLFDYQGCYISKHLPLNPHGHALWHLFMGYFAYLSIIILRLLEDTRNGKDVDIYYRYHFLPCIIKNWKQIEIF